MTGEIKFLVGDLVTRDGTDVQRVIWIDSDLIEVECVKEPLGFLLDDGTRDIPWCAVGERETNLTRRYSHAGDVIDLTENGDSECTRKISSPKR